MKIILLISLHLLHVQAMGSIELPYLIKILTENIKRYEQLKEMMKQSDDMDQFIRALNQGIDNASGLLDSISSDHGDSLNSLGKLQGTLYRLQKIYGTIPEGRKHPILIHHDQVASEGIKLMELSQDYAKKQEYNAEMVFKQAQSASPVGAQRMTAQMSAQILHILNQILRVNAQILRLQSEQFAYGNKKGKDHAKHFNQLNQDIEKSFQFFEISHRFPRFN